MSRQIQAAQIMSAGVMTGTATLTSNTVDVSATEFLSIELVWTGTANGAFTIEASISGSNWVTLTVDPTIGAAVGSADSRFISLANFTFPKVRVKYVNTSGTGALDVYVCGKG